MSLTFVWIGEIAWWQRSTALPCRRTQKSSSTATLKLSLAGPPLSTIQSITPGGSSSRAGALGLLSHKLLDCGHQIEISDRFLEKSLGSSVATAPFVGKCVARG